MNRGRMGSRPELREPHAPEVWEVLGEHESAIQELKGLAQKNELTSATILTEVRELRATDRHATTKLIVAAISTIAVTVGSVLGGTALMKPAAPVTQPGPTRSALDVRLDACRSMQPNTVARTECFTRTVSEPEP